MRLRHWIAAKLTDRYRQFGIIGATVQILKRAAAPVYMRESFWILAFDGPYVAGQLKHPVVAGGEETLRSAEDSGQIPAGEAQVHRQFLEAGCRGFFASAGDAIAGWAWLQPRGTYDFGQSGTFQVPEGTGVFKNDYVRREFRGRGIAADLTRARLASLDGMVALTFVRTENRYSLRYYRQCGFQPLVRVTRSRWLNNDWRTRAEAKTDSPLARQILAGLGVAAVPASVTAVSC